MRLPTSSPTRLTLMSRNRSTLIPRIHPGLVDLFRSTLTPDLHVGFACQLYDLLYTLQWMVAQDPADLVSARSDIADPLSQHARHWQARLQLPARTTIGAPPYRVAYLGRTSNLGVTNAVQRCPIIMFVPPKSGA